MNETLSEDSLAILLLCSNLAISDKTDNAGKPFTLKEWDNLSHKLKESPMERPLAFFRKSHNEWQNYLELSNEQIERIQKLLSRGGQLGIELERLKSLGIWVTTRAEETYPTRLKKILGRKSPVVLYGAGDLGLLNSEGVAIVGSRDVDEGGALFAQKLSWRCATEELTVVSGGSRGVDLIAQNAAIRAGGRVIAVLSDGLETSIRQREQRELILSRKLVLLSAYNPKARFTVYTAKERDKHIYALSKYAIVVSAALNKGGSWGGATENLKSRWVPLFVRAGVDIPLGNKRLIEFGGIPLDLEVVNNKEIQLRDWFNSLAKQKRVNEIAQADGNKLGTVENKGLQIDLKFEESKVLERVDTIRKASIGVDLFTIVWPHIENALTTPQSERDLAAAFKVNTKQIHDWLERAVNIGKVKKLINTSQYVSVPYFSGSQSTPKIKVEQKSVYNSLDNIPKI